MTVPVGGFEWGRQLRAVAVTSPVHHHEAALLLAAVAVLGGIALVEVTLGAVVLSRRHRTRPEEAGPGEAD